MHTRKLPEITQPGSKITQPDCEITQLDCKITQSRSKITQTGREISQSGSKITQPGREIPQSDCKITQSGREIWEYHLTHRMTSSHPMRTGKRTGNDGILGFINLSRLLIFLIFNVDTLL